MTLFSVCSLLGAVALFLFGMELLRGGLCRMSQKRLQPLLMRSTQTVWQAVLLGAVVTAFVQSSGTDWGPLCAATSIILIPVVVFFFVAQKYMISGLTGGAVKG